MVHGGQADYGATGGLWVCFRPTSSRCFPPIFDRRRGLQALYPTRRPAQAHLKNRGRSESPSKRTPRHRTTPQRSSPRFTERTPTQGLEGTRESPFTARHQRAAGGITLRHLQCSETDHRRLRPSSHERTLSMKLPRLECEHTQRLSPAVTYRGATPSTTAHSSTFQEDALR